MKDMGETVMTCPNCECKICLLCNDILDPNTPHNKDCQSKLYSQLSEQNRKWILTNSKDCPMCHNVYEKNQGCNHMTCTVCRPPTHFCYLCGNILNNKNPLTHFSDKESKCYNRLWDDEVKNNIDINNNNNNESYDEDNNKEDSKIDNNDNEGNYIGYSSRNYNSNRNYNYNNDRRMNYKNEDLNLTRIMIDRVSQNDSYRNGSHKIYRYSNINNNWQRMNNYSNIRGENINYNNKYHSERFNK